MNKPGWSHFDHQADIGIEGRGTDMAQAFAQAGLALIAVMTDPNLIRPRESRILTCTGDDPELLLFDFINEIIFLISSEGMIFSRIEVDIKDSGLEARLLGEPIDPDRHDPAVEIKGASFNSLWVGQNKKGLWVARCVVDV